MIAELLASLPYDPWPMWPAQTTPIPSYECSEAERAHPSHRDCVACAYRDRGVDDWTAVREALGRRR